MPFARCFCAWPQCFTVIICRVYKASTLLQCCRELVLVSRPASHHPSRASLSGGLRGLSCVAGHVCSWRWRPCYANPPLRLRKVPFLPVQKENNKEGFSTPSRRRPRATGQCFLISIYPCMTLISNQTPHFTPGKIKRCAVKYILSHDSRISGKPSLDGFSRGATVFPVVITTRGFTSIWSLIFL